MKSLIIGTIAILGSLSVNAIAGVDQDIHKMMAMVNQNLPHRADEYTVIERAVYDQGTRTIRYIYTVDNDPIVIENISAIQAGSIQHWKYVKCQVNQERYAVIEAHGASVQWEYYLADMLLLSLNSRMIFC